MSTAMYSKYIVQLVSPRYKEAEALTVIKLAIRFRSILAR